MNARGMKVIVSGRLNGGEIARVEQDKFGKVPLHTLRADIDYGYSIAYTIYGTVGVRVWIYKGEVLPERQLMAAIAAEAATEMRRPKRAPREDAPTRPADETAGPEVNPNVDA